MSTPTISAANAAEREASNRVQAASERVTSAQKDAEISIENVRDQYQKQYLTEASRQQAQLESQKNKGYEELREIQRAQKNDIRRTKAEGEREAFEVSDYYRNILNTQEHSGSEKLRELVSQNARQVEYERQIGNEQEAEVKEASKLRTDEAKEAAAYSLNQLNTQSRKAYETKRAEVTEKTERADGQLEDLFVAKLQHNHEVINDLDIRANKEIHDIRQKTAEKISAYSQRQKDPFYKLVDLHAELKDEGEYYSLTAKIPEFEQKHLSILIKGGNLILSGSRRNEEKLNLGQNHYQQSASYQTYQESFPLVWPVDPNRISREFKGDLVTIRVPKKGDFIGKKPEKPIPEKIKGEFPIYPENLPIKHTDNLAGSFGEDLGAPKPAPGRPGSKTLT